MFTIQNECKGENSLKGDQILPPSFFFRSANFFFTEFSRQNSLQIITMFYLDPMMVIYDSGGQMLLPEEVLRVPKNAKNCSMMKP